MQLVIDSHCHLDLAVFDADRAAVLARAAAAGVQAILVPAIRPATWPRLLEVCAEHGARGPGTSEANESERPVHCALIAALGVHPQIVPDLTPDERTLGTDADALAAAIETWRGKGAVPAGLVRAVGECGLDGGTADLALQETVLRAHVRAARQLRLPLALHVLRAHDLAVRVLREERVQDVGGVMHSYSGGAALVPVYRDLGLCFSLAGPVTYARARRPVEAARAIPAELLLAETDAPDQTPVPHQGQRCEPAFVADVVEGLARARGATRDELAALTTRNAARLLRLT